MNFLSEIIVLFLTNLTQILSLNVILAKKLQVYKSS